MNKIYAEQFLILLLILGLVGSATSQILLTPYLLIFVVYFGLLVSIGRLRINILAPSKWCLILFSYAILTMVMSGAGVDNLVNFDFYRYDGNLFYSFFPLLVLPFVNSVDLNFKSVATFFVLTACLFYTISFFVGYEPFDAHNAMGGFLSIVLCVSIYLIRMNMAYVPLMVWVFALLVFTDSRGSIVAVLIGVLSQVLLKNGKHRRMFVILSVFCSAVFLGALLYGYVLWVDAGMPVAQTLDDYAQISEESGLTLDVGLERSYTVAHRMMIYWPQAVHDFLKSPIFGIGFGRYDDFPRNYYDYLFGVYSPNMASNSYHTNYHAHNSVLHIVAELGMVGAFVFFKVFLGAWRSVCLKENEEFRLFQLMIFTIFFAALTEHRLTTPSMMIPFWLIYIFILKMKGTHAK